VAETAHATGWPGACYEKLTVRAFLVASIVGTAATAHAEPAAAPAVETKSPALAGALAVGTPIAGVLVAVVADGSLPLEVTAASLFAFGPSLGHVYAGEYKHAAVSTLIRGGAYAGFALSAIKWTKISDPECEVPGCYKPRTADVLEVTMVVTALIFVGATAYTWYDAPRAARRTNHRRAQLAIVPTGTGLYVAGSF